MVRTRANFVCLPCRADVADWVNAPWARETFLLGALAMETGGGANVDPHIDVPFSDAPLIKGSSATRITTSHSIVRAITY